MTLIPCATEREIAARTLIDQGNATDAQLADAIDALSASRDWQDIRRVSDARNRLWAAGMPFEWLDPPRHDHWRFVRWAKVIAAYAVIGASVIFALGLFLVVVAKAFS